MAKQLNLAEFASLIDQMEPAIAEWRQRTNGQSASALSDYFAILTEATAVLRQRVEAIGGRFSEPGDGIALTLGGLRAVSTQGFQGACRNWLTAARKQLETSDF